VQSLEAHLQVPTGVPGGMIHSRSPDLKTIGSNGQRGKRDELP
jgi:hypothetical protein